MNGAELEAMEILRSLSRSQHSHRLDALAAPPTSTKEKTKNASTMRMYSTWRPRGRFPAHWIRNGAFPSTSDRRPGDAGIAAVKGMPTIWSAGDRQSGNAEHCARDRSGQWMQQKWEPKRYVASFAIGKYLYRFVGRRPAWPQSLSFF